MAYYGDYQKDFKKLIDKYSGLTAPPNMGTYTTKTSGGSLSMKDMRKAIEALANAGSKPDHYIMGDWLKQALEKDEKYGSYKEPYITTRNPLARLFNSISELIGQNVVYL